MEAQVHEASVAFTYAWWLTGDDEAAADAVGAAARALPAGGAPEARIHALLREVRRIAAPQRTMCPASELALLHDAQALPLEVAAELVEISPSDARTELAHGRLEALLETVEAPFTHPERLGGLAVGNPPDIAHARTCRSCAEVLDLLRRGRQELHALPPIPPPAALVAALADLDEAAAEAATTGPVRVSRRGAGPAPPAPARPEAEAPDVSDQADATEQTDATDATDATGQDGTVEQTAPTADTAPAEDAPATPVAGTAPTAATAPMTAGGSAPLVFDDLEQLDLSTIPTGEETETRSRRRSLLVGIGAVAFGLVVLLVTALTSDIDRQPDEGISGPVTRTAPPEEETPDPAEAAPVSPPTPAAPDADDAEEADGADEAAPDGDAPFTVASAGVLPLGADAPQPSGAAIAPEEALRVAIAYTGAAEGVELMAAPAIPGGEAPARSVTLSSQRSSHVFVWLAPEDGWPAGRHQIELLADGELAGIVDVTVR